MAPPRTAHHMITITFIESVIMPHIITSLSQFQWILHYSLHHILINLCNALTFFSINFSAHFHRNDVKCLSLNHPCACWFTATITPDSNYLMCWGCCAQTILIDLVFVLTFLFSKRLRQILFRRKEFQYC